YYKSQPCPPTLHQLIVSRNTSNFLHISFFPTASSTTDIYTLSLHDALPISRYRSLRVGLPRRPSDSPARCRLEAGRSPSRRHRADRKSTRLNSSHDQISYAVFCLKKKKHDAARKALDGVAKENRESAPYHVV